MMRRGIIVLGALIAAAPFGARGARAAGSPFKHLRYYDYPSSHLFVATDGSWSGAHVVPVPAVLHPPTPADPFGKRGLRSEFIWAASCSVGPQFVSFSKTILTPGAPYSGTFLLQYGLTGAGMTRPYHSAVLLVNGVVIEKLDTAETAINGAAYRSGPVPAPALQSFRDGANTLTVRVQKTALPKGDRSCTIPSAPGGRLRYIGVNATLDLGFGAAIEALPSSKGKVQLERNVKAGQDVLVTGRASVRNNGPSSSLEGVITVTVGGYNYAKLIVDPNVVGIGNGSKLCASDATLTSLTCPYTDFRAGRKIRIPTAVGIKVPADFHSYDVQSVVIQWSITQKPFDYAPTTTTTNQHTIVICGPLATDTCHA